MERAEIILPVKFEKFPEIEAGIVNWPMSVLRLRSKSKTALVELADQIRIAWSGYSDEANGVVAFTDETPHNAITPIARRRGEDFELDLVLRNNLTSEEFPMGIYHPHADKHNIKKENIGLIEVMGLAILPARLKKEMARLGEIILAGGDVRADADCEKHAEWLDSFKSNYTFTAENTEDILKKEIGIVFAKVLEHAGVFKRDEQGINAFKKFAESVK
jgi:UDPglucose--hexose-1-phosphate uridylyltransferase